MDVGVGVAQVSLELAPSDQDLNLGPAALADCARGWLE
jgi:hypothetical protein